MITSTRSGSFSRTFPMRLAFALVAVLTVSPAMARDHRCMARAHPGAKPYVSQGTAAEPPQPADTSLGSHAAGPDDAEVASIDRDDKGDLWVYRVHEFAWRRADVTLYGDCRRAGP